MTIFELNIVEEDRRQVWYTHLRKCLRVMTKLMFTLNTNIFNHYDRNLSVHLFFLLIMRV